MINIARPVIYIARSVVLKAVTARNMIYTARSVVLKAVTARNMIYTARSAVLKAVTARNMIYIARSVVISAVTARNMIYIARSVVLKAVTARNMIYIARSVVRKAVTLKIRAFCEVKWFSLTDSYRCFGRTCCHHLQFRRCWWKSPPIRCYLDKWNKRHHLTGRLFVLMLHLHNNNKRKFRK